MPRSLVDIDAQGAEQKMLCCGMISWLSDRVERLHVSTHTPWIHDSILQWLREAEWTVEIDAWYTRTELGAASYGYRGEI